MGVKISGSSDFLISKNDFYGQHVGTFLEATYSGLTNLQSDNNFSSCDYAIMANYDNDRYIFEDNCFNYSNGQDVIVVASGNSTNPLYNIARINDNIGDIDEAAGNIFTISPILGSISTNATALASDVTYHMHPSTEGDDAGRKIPNLLWGNLVEHAFDSQLDSEGSCGSNGTVGPVRINYNYDCNVPLGAEDKAAYLTALTEEYAELITELELLEPYSLEWWLIRYQMTQIESCMIFSSPLVDLEGQNCDSLVMLHSRQDQLPISVRTRLFGALRQIGCCSMMESLADTTRIFVNDVDYDVTHMHSIIYDLECSNDRDISKDRIERLYDFGIQSHIPVSGYARGLYNLLTRDRIVVDIPDIDIKVEQREGNVSEVKKPYLSCNPNPTYNKTNICEVTTPYSGSFEVTIYDQSGRTLFESSKIYAQYETKSFEFDIDLKGLAFIILRDSRSKELIDQLTIVKL